MGRKAGSLLRAKCCICSTVEMASGTSGYYRCTTCVAAGRRNPRQHRSNWLGKDVALASVHAEVRAGNLPHAKTQKCADCGGAACEYEHRDYNKPLDVVPICRRCNLLRGPAIPERGSVAQLVRAGRVPYRLRRNARRVLVLLGQPTDILNDMPVHLTNAHWVQLLPLFEQSAQA